MGEYYCVGMSMQADWGDDETPKLDRRLLVRVFGTFRPYLGRGALALLCIVAASLLALAPVLLVGLPIAVIPARTIGRRAYRARQETQEKLGELTAYLQEILGISGVLLVKAFARERTEETRFGTLNDEVRRLEIRQAMV